MESFRPVFRRLYTEYNAIYGSNSHTKMYQNTSLDFKLGYVDAKSDAIAFCVKTYSSGSFIKNRTNMHEMQNRMKIAFCVKPPNLRFCLRIKGAPREVFGDPSVGLAPALDAAVFGKQVLLLNEKNISKYTFNH